MQLPPITATGDNMRNRRRRRSPHCCESLVLRLVWSHALAGGEIRNSAAAALSHPPFSSSFWSSRRSFLFGTEATTTAAAATASLALLLPYAAVALPLESPKDPPLPDEDLLAIPSTPATPTVTTGTTFRSLAYGKAEYTNSITASRDTNLSPLEAYDVIRQRIPPAASYSATSSSLMPRVLDVGAGAGLSTSVLYHELGYRSIDAVDWSDVAWKSHVMEQPDSVHFYALDDDSYFQTLRQSSEEKNKIRYQAIIYNFAVNADKASRVAQTYLDPTSSSASVMLAPINDKTDYWYKQKYAVYNATGHIVWESDPDVGAWSVQFQPDVTSNTCTGIWCGSYNGFRRTQ